MHTPGPWHITTNYKGITEIINRFVRSKSPHPFYIALIHPPLPHHLRDKEANARLIAAAPDLLTALEAVRERYATVSERGGIEVAITPELYRQIESAVGSLDIAAEKETQ